MNNSLEIKLKEDKDPTIWQRFLQWLDGGKDQPLRLGQQVPKTGTNTEILLSQTQKVQLISAVESPLLERTSDTTSFVRRTEPGREGPDLFI